MLRCLSWCFSKADTSEEENDLAWRQLESTPKAEDALASSDPARSALLSDDEAKEALDELPEDLRWAVPLTLESPSEAQLASDSTETDDEWKDALEELAGELSLEIPDDSRWRSVQDGKVVSTERVGDLFIAQLWRLVSNPAVDIDMENISVLFPGLTQLLEYENEPRRLMRLAHTGRAVDMVESLHRAMDAYLLAQHVSPSKSLASDWRSELLQERGGRLLHYQSLLADGEVFEAQVDQEIDHDQEDGEFEYALELLTVLKHDYHSYSDSLLPTERDVMLTVYDRVASLAGVTVMTIPKWFAPPLDSDTLRGITQWRGAFVGVDYESAKKNEEGFVSGVVQWLDLNHPHIAKLYGACHVGKRFYVHEIVSTEDDDMPTSETTEAWQLVHQCALGLWYLLERGMPYRVFSVGMVAKEVFEGKCKLLHGVGIAASSSAGDRSESSRASDMCYLAEAAWPMLRPDDADFELSRATVDRECPPFLTEAKWSVLTAMIKTDENDMAGMLGILQQLQQLAAASDEVVTTSLTSLDEPLRNAVVPATNRSFEQMFVKLRELFDNNTDAGDSNDRILDIPVFDRLVVVYYQLEDQLCSSLPTELLKNFTNVVARFYRNTVVRSEQSVDSMFSAFSESCGVRSVAGRNYSYHHELDRVIASPVVDPSDSVHDWKPRWREAQRRLVQQSPLGDNTGSGSPSTAVLAAITEEDHESDEPSEEKSPKSPDQASSDASLDERAVLTQFEATKRRGAYSADAIAPLDLALARSTRSLVVPEWFIPSYEVELGDFLGQGAFGAVYRGKWFDTGVVIKILLSDTPEQRRAFVREAEVWFALNHPNVVHLFGACHVGPRPFFVCEFAGRFSLTEYRSHSSYDEELLNASLHAMAAGLQSLHDHGIVHGDLKGNNILVDEDTFPKLADFGLSRFVQDDGDEDESDGVGALGAYRWKAPECLSGSRPTFASDVFSLAMCIIEFKTGEYPWGTTDDSVVIYHVKRGLLPARPDCFTAQEWDLVKRMCCFDPSERIDIAEVVETLDSWRRAGMQY